MRYLLDTNTCIRYINGRSPGIRAKLPTIQRTEIGVSIITKAEMYYGSAKSQTPKRSREKQLEFLETVITVGFSEQAASLMERFGQHLSDKVYPSGLMIC